MKERPPEKAGSKAKAESFRGGKTQLPDRNDDRLAENPRGFS